MDRSDGVRRQEKDWFELCLDKYPDIPAVVLIRSVELKLLPSGLLRPPVLDLCCGDGFFAHALGLVGVCGCDIDAQAVERARTLGKTYDRVVVDDARTLGEFRDNSFNSVLANCALEHVEGIDRALRSIARVLRPGGCLVMTVPADSLNAWFLPKRLFKSIGLSGYGNRLCEEYNRKQRHLNICSLGTWTGKLEESGLSRDRYFHAFTRSEYGSITLFETCGLPSLPGRILRVLFRAFEMAVPARVRKAIWRNTVKRIYRDARPLASGGELFIVARKHRHRPVG